MKTLKFDHVALSVRDLAKSAEFYEKLGFVPAKNWRADDGSLEIALMKNDGMILELFCYRDGEHLPEYRRELATDLPVAGTKHFALCTENLEETAQILRSRGVCGNVKIATGRLGRDYFFIRDPDGILIEIITVGTRF